MHASSSNPILATALDLAAQGVPVFPCKATDKNPSHQVPRDRDEHGELIAKTGGLYKASTDPKQIERWWKKEPDAMIGAVMGEKAGLWAVDPDAPEKEGDPDGVAIFNALITEHGLPRTRVHRTPGGGSHYLFRWNPSHPIRNQEGGLQGKNIHVRGNGGYVIWPPSVSYNDKTYGIAYRVAEPVEIDEILEAPDWLLDLIEAPKAASESPNGPSEPFTFTAPPDLDRYVARALEEEVDAVARAPNGKRNARLNQAAFNLAQLVPHGLLSESEIVRALLAAAEGCGLLQEDGGVKVRATIESGLRGGKANPRDLHKVEARRRDSTEAV